MSLNFLSRLTAFDLLAKPIYKRGTKVGAFTSLAIFIVFIWYATQTIVEASLSTTVTTSVNTTPYESNQTLTWTMTCPKIDALADSDIFGKYDEITEALIENTYFSHCFVYAPSCPTLKVKGKQPSDNLFSNTIFIAAGDTVSIEICHEVQAFYSGTARIEDGGIDCMANPKYDSNSLERPSWPISFYSNSTPFIDKLEFNEGFMAANGEVYTYSSVLSSDLNGVVTDSSFMSSTGQGAFEPSGTDLQPLIEFLCRDSDFNHTFITIQYDDFPIDISALPGVYSQSFLNYKTDTVNNLRYNTLAVLGSIGGAWSGLCAVAGIVLMIYFMVYPLKTAPLDYEVLGINNPDIYEPPKKRQQPIMLKFDILMSPIYSLGTVIGTAMTLLTFVGTLFYMVYLFYNASNGNIQTTNVWLTPTNASSRIVTWNVTCPSTLTSEYTAEAFTHCIFVQPDCANYKVQSIKAGEMGNIQTCFQTAAFYAGAAIMYSNGTKVDCRGDGMFELPVWPVLSFQLIREGYPSVEQLDDQDLDVTDVIGYTRTEVTLLTGEPYIKETLIATQAIASGQTRAEFTKQAKAFSEIGLCSDSNFDFFQNMVTVIGDGQSKSFYTSNMPETYRYSPQFLEISMQNELRSNWLALIGSVSGAMSGILSIAGLIYIFVLLKYPPPRLNAAVLGYIPKEKEHLNEKLTPNVPKKVNWFDYADLLVEPISNNPTSAGGILSILSAIVYLLYGNLIFDSVVYTFIQAGDTILQSTAIETTPKSSNSIVAQLTFNCPPASQLKFEEQSFDNCFIYSPNCTALGDKGLITFQPGTRTSINLCVKKNPFYAGMIASPNSVLCSGNNSDIENFEVSNLRLPFAAWNEGLVAGSFSELADLEGEMSVFTAGESYTYLKQIQEDISGPTRISHVLTQRDAAPKVSAKGVAEALQPLANTICTNEFSLAKLYTGEGDATQTGPLGQINPAPFSFSSIYYVAKRVNSLRSSWLSILGSIAGAWGAVFGLFKVIYLLVQMIYPPDPLDLVELRIITEKKGVATSEKVQKSTVMVEDAVSPSLSGPPLL